MGCGKSSEFVEGHKEHKYSTEYFENNTYVGKHLIVQIRCRCGKFVSFCTECVKIKGILNRPVKCGFFCKNQTYGRVISEKIENIKQSKYRKRGNHDCNRHTITKFIGVHGRGENYSRCGFCYNNRCFKCGKWEFSALFSCDECRRNSLNLYFPERKCNNCNHVHRKSYKCGFEVAPESFSSYSGYQNNKYTYGTIHNPSVKCTCEE